MVLELIEEMIEFRHKRMQSQGQLHVLAEDKSKHQDKCSVLRVSGASIDEKHTSQYSVALLLLMVVLSDMLFRMDNLQILPL